MRGGRSVVVSTVVSTVVATVMATVAVGCGANDASSTTAVPVATETPSSVATDFLSVVAQACADANQMAYTDAERLGYWSKELTPAEQAEYFSGRAVQVDWLVAELRALTPEGTFTTRWPTLLGILEDYGAWARENVRTITATGTTVPERSPDSLQSFRAAFDLGFGNACQDLFDMN